MTSEMQFFDNTSDRLKSYSISLAYLLFFYDYPIALTEELTLETSAFLPFTVANLRFQPSC